VIMVLPRTWYLSRRILALKNPGLDLREVLGRRDYLFPDMISTKNNFIPTPFFMLSVLKIIFAMLGMLYFSKWPPG
jgi:hypothetical protein